MDRFEFWALLLLLLWTIFDIRATRKELSDVKEELARMKKSLRG